MGTTFTRAAQGKLTSRPPNGIIKSTGRVETNKTIIMLKESKWRDTPSRDMN